MKNSNNIGNLSELEQAAKSGGVNAVMNKLTPDQGAKLKAVLSDEKALREILSSPKAQALIKELEKK